MTNPDIRAAFQSWWHQTHTFGSPATIEDVARRAFEAGITHAASLSNSVAAGKLPPLPAPHVMPAGYYPDQPKVFTADMMRAYGKQCADAARQPAPVLSDEQIWDLLVDEVGVEHISGTGEYAKSAAVLWTPAQAAEVFRAILAATRSQP